MLPLREGINVSSPFPNTGVIFIHQRRMLFDSSSGSTQPHKFHTDRASAFALSVSLLQSSSSITMPLRAIDNALPKTTDQRPRKQSKVVLPATKQSERSLNDENQIPMQPSGDVAIDYISSEYLKPISNPEARIQGLIDDLDSKNWLKVCEALNDVRRFALYHSSILFPELGKVTWAVAETMKNPRSALCKNSIMAASDIFKSYGDKLLDPSTSDAFDNLLLQLMLKASQDKRFVCEEADRALTSMVTSIAPLPLLVKLLIYVSHRNLRVRAKAAISLSNSISKMGVEEMKEFGLGKMIKVAADLLNDRLPEAREAARSIATSMYGALTKDEEQKLEAWQNFCQSKLPPIHALSLFKTINP